MQRLLSLLKKRKKKDKQSKAPSGKNDDAYLIPHTSASPLSSVSLSHLSLSPLSSFSLLHFLSLVLGIFEWKFLDMDDDGDWITARYLLSSILGRNPLVVDYVDEESFPVEDPPPVAGGARGGRQAVVSQPPVVRATAGVAGTVCSVCTEEIAVADAVVRLPCAHWYHAGCISPWLGIRSTCPMCRAELPASDDAAEEGGGAGREKPPRAGRAGTSAGGGVRRDASYELLAGGGVLSG